jgi:hypothetical protein
MPDLTAKRTLVKSPPELWEELSAVEGLTKHFGAFGEIKITKLEPEHTVAWEGERASGTVSIEPSGWGTKVTLHAELQQGAAELEAAEPDAVEPVEAETAASTAVEAVEPGTAAPTAVEQVEPGTAAPTAVDPEKAAPTAVEWETAASTAVEPETAAPTAVEAEPVEPEPVGPEPVPVRADPAPETVAAESDAEPVVEDPTAKRRGFWSWLFRTRTAAQLSLAVDSGTEPVPVSAQHDTPEDEPKPDRRPTVVESEVVDPVAVEVQPESLDIEPQPGEVAPEPEATEDEPEVVQEQSDDAPIDPDRARLVLDEALDALGAAHHRPFSRG